MIRLICICFSSLYVLGMVASTARADAILSFTSDGTLGTFQVTVGDMIGVPIYLSGDSRLASQGLYSAGATVNYAYESGAGDSSHGNASIFAVQLNPQWTNTALNYVEIDNGPGNQFAVLEGLVDGPDVEPVRPAPGNSYVLIGTVMFQAGMEGNITQLNLSNALNLPFINLLYNTDSGDPLDGQISYVGGRILTVTATPEPSTLIAFSIAGGLLVARRSIARRRARAAMST